MSQDLANFWKILEADVAKVVRLELRRIERGQRHRTAEKLTAYLDGMMWAAASQVSVNNYKTHQSSWCNGSFIMHSLTQVNGQCERDPFGGKSARKRPRGVAATAEQRPGRTGGHPRAGMRKKIQLDTGPGAACGALNRKNI